MFYLDFLAAVEHPDPPKFLLPLKICWKKMLLPKLLPNFWNVLAATKNWLTFGHASF